MTEIEKIERYIRNTKVKPAPNGYSLRMREVQALRSMGDLSGAICIAFAYGRAKGERHARATMKAREGGDTI